VSGFGDQDDGSQKPADMIDGFYIVDEKLIRS